jgi:hypothetical protein
MQLCTVFVVEEILACFSLFEIGARLCTGQTLGVSLLRN